MKKMNRMKKIIYLASLVIFLVASSPAIATSVWMGGTSDLWNDSTNWDPVGLPDGADNTFIDGSRSNLPVRIVSGDNAQASHLMMGQLSNTGTAELIVEGGHLGLTFDIWLGYNTGGQGVLTVSGGSVGGITEDYARSLIIGSKDQNDTSTAPVEGIVNLESGMIHAWNTYLPQDPNGKGTLNIYDGLYKTRNMYLSWGDNTGDGTINLFGGTLEVYYWMDINSPRGHIDIAEGQLILNGDVSSQVQTWVDVDGYITAYGGERDVLIELVDGNTIVTACPWPDLSGDCYVDFNDFALLAQEWNQGPQYPTGDPLDEDFESGDFSQHSWQLSGDASWTVVSGTANGGVYSAQSGAISDSQQTAIEISLYTGPGTIQFYNKVSTEQDYDFLRFYIDGDLKGEWSGEQAWTLQSYEVRLSGIHTFKWVYEKDFLSSGGSDTVWLDDIQYIE